MVKKKARSWLIFLFCNVLDRIFSFVYVKEFNNKKLILDLFSILLESFPHIFLLPA